MTEVRIVLVGRTGAGKSSTGNNIVQRDFFESTASGTSVTRKCQRATGMRSGVRIEIVDTPGLFDTSMSQEEITREIVKCIGITAPGPHAFVMVIRIDRFTKEEQNTVEHLKKVFGERMSDYLIVLFTRKDDLTNDGQTIDQYVQRAPPALRELLDSCNNRYVAFNNHGSEDERNGDVKNLLDRIEETLKENGGAYYTNSMYEEAERVMQMREDQIRRENRKDADVRRQEIEDECRKQMKEIEENQREITEPVMSEITRLESLKTCSQSADEIQSLQKELQEMKSLLDDTRRELADFKAQAEKEASQKQAKVDEAMSDPRQQAREEVNKGDNIMMQLFKFLSSDDVMPIVHAVIRGIAGVVEHGFEKFKKSKPLKQQKACDNNSKGPQN